jgi:hypothetical protein
MSYAVTETTDSNLPTELLSPAQLSHLRLLEAESIHNPHEKAAEFEGPVTAGEREARWGHRGGVLELSGPAHIVNAVERALFAVGVTISHIDADGDPFLFDLALLRTLIKAQVAAGLVVLLVRTNQSDTLIARVDNQQVKFDAAEPMPAITGVYQLLHRAEIFISSERAGL